MLNQVALMGRLTKDLELRVTNSGTSVATFSIAVDRDFAAEGKEKETDFINCVAWKYTAEFISKYFTKGSLISVIGRLQMRSYTNKNDEKVTVYEVVVDRAYFCGGKEKEDPEKAPPKSKSKFIEMDEDDGELPF